MYIALFTYKWKLEKTRSNNIHIHSADCTIHTCDWRNKKKERASRRKRKANEWRKEGKPREPKCVFSCHIRVHEYVSKIRLYIYIWIDQDYHWTKTECDKNDDDDGDGMENSVSTSFSLLQPFRPTSFFHTIFLSFSPTGSANYITSRTFIIYIYIRAHTRASFRFYALT